MNFKPLKFSITLAMLAAAAGCTTHPTVSGGKTTTVLGGVMTASGTRISVLWGLLTFHDY